VGTCGFSAARQSELKPEFRCCAVMSGSTKTGNLGFRFSSRDGEVLLRAVEIESF